MIQYPKLVHTTLPSVSDWNTDINIIRDPPKSITTFRKDRVGESSFLTEVVDGSIDRANEYISVYARGVNPMVSVSYANHGNGNNVMSQNKQVKLPYRTMIDGAFIPPVRTEYDLLPLSRLPRVWFGALTQPGFADYSKGKFCPTKFRMIKDIIKNIEVKANKTAKVEKAILENYKMTDTINDKHINVAANSGIRSMDISSYTRDNVDKYKGVNDTILEAWADTNKSQRGTQGLDGLSIDKAQYVHDVLNVSGNTNKFVQNTQGLDNISMDMNNNIQDVLQFETNAGYNPGYTIIGEMGDIELERNLPSHNISSQYSDSRVNKTLIHENDLQYERNLPIQKDVASNIRKIENFNSINLSSRDYRLSPSLDKGGFSNEGVLPIPLGQERVFPQTNEQGQKTNMKENKAKIRSEVNSLYNRDYRPQPIIYNNDEQLTKILEKPMSEKEKRKLIMNDLIFNRN
jgi:hypothetical protein